MADSANPQSVSIDDASRILTAVGAKHASVADIKQDVDAGAPVDASGGINLIQYAAWLLKQAGEQRLESEGSVE